MTAMLCLFAGSMMAGDVKVESPTSVMSEADVHQKISMMVKKINPMITIKTLTPTPMTGIYQVVLASGEILHASTDGQHFIVGDMYTTNNSGLVNLTEKSKSTERLALLNSVDDKQAIIYKAEGEKRGRVTIFTDVNCGYCRKVHQEVPALTKSGIEVRYLAYPREGIINPQTREETQTYLSMQSIWCSADQKKALSDVKNQLYIKPAKCENPIAQQLELGHRLGVQGTPAMFLDDGTMIPGYVTADQLKQKMGLN